MKLKCDLCGSALQVNLGGESATCTGCGLTYSLARLKEMLDSILSDKLESPKAELSNPKDPKPETPKGNPQKDIIHEVTNWEKVAPKEDVVYDITNWSKVDTPKQVFSYTPLQFRMENSGNGIADLFGLVLQGGIGLGDSVYLDNDYAHPYKVYCINDDADVTCVKEGMAAELFVHIPTRQRKILANAHMITGDPHPVANAYNYPGTVQEYFSKLLTSEFPQYDIRENIPRNELKIPVHFMFYQNEKPVLAVFLISSNDSSARYQVEKAAHILAPEGVACTHFFENYRNDRPYVIQRIQAALD